MYRWKPSKKQAREFAEQMQEIKKFCEENNIFSSLSNDSYYFTVNGQNYRVSNHTIQSSNAHAYNEFGEQIREKYHTKEELEHEIQIFASKTRIIEIYNNLKSGKKLDKRGNIMK